MKKHINPAQAAVERLADVWSIYEGCDIDDPSELECQRDAKLSYDATVMAYRALGMRIERRKNGSIIVEYNGDRAELNWKEI